MGISEELGRYILGLKGSWSVGVEVVGLDLCWTADGGAG